jgi:hypothetical protein
MKIIQLTTDSQGLVGKTFRSPARAFAQAKTLSKQLSETVYVSEQTEEWGDTDLAAFKDGEKVA